MILIIIIFIECAKLRQFWRKMFFIFNFISNYYYILLLPCAITGSKEEKNLTYSYHKFNLQMLSVPVNSLLILKQINRYYSLLGANKWAGGMYQFERFRTMISGWWCEIASLFVYTTNLVVESRSDASQTQI